MPKPRLVQSDDAAITAAQLGANGSSGDGRMLRGGHRHAALIDRGPFGESFKLVPDFQRLRCHVEILFVEEKLYDN